MCRAGRGNGDSGLPCLLALAAGVQRALCAQLSTELGEPLQAPPLVNSSPHWSAASLPTAPQCSRLLLIYCSAHEILMQERLEGGGAAPGLRDGGGGPPRQAPSLQSEGQGSLTWGEHLPPTPRFTKGLVRASASASLPAALP